MKTHLAMRALACKLLLLVLVVVPAALIAPGAVPPAGATRPTEEWVARYNGPGNGEDSAQQLAVDCAGNFYVTGSSYDSTGGLDYATIKYDTAGNQQWVARYDDQGHGDDRAHDVAADCSGNVYVTGISWDPLARASGYDYATVKYDTDGNQQWVAVYDGGNGTDEAYGIAVDSGNVYVTGGSQDSPSGDNDGVTVKYNASGDQQWATRYDAAGGDDWNHRVTVDSAGNVYTVGMATRPGHGRDYITTKFDSSGNIPTGWPQFYDGAGGEDDAWPVAVDGAGNVFVTGWSTSADGDTDYTTIKYGPSGGLPQWVTPYDGPAGGNDAAWDVALGPAGNPVVTGQSAGIGTGPDIATVKYDSATGNQVWVARYDYIGQPDGGAAVAVGDGVYVTGGVDTDAGPAEVKDYVTIKYDYFGNEQWVARYDYAGGDDGPKDLVLGPAGNPVVTGFSSNGSDYDYATIKYSPPMPHYACHAAPGVLVPPQVTVTTQFGTETINPGPGVGLCAPALKNGEGTLDTAHLRSFAASGPAPGRLVNLTTQFGELRNVFVGEIAMFSAPTDKLPGPVPPPAYTGEPHYLSYSITGPSADKDVILEWQFAPGPLPIHVGEPQLLSLPAGKNGAPIPDAPVGVCYHTMLPPPLMGTYSVWTRFFPESALQVFEGSLLCVPAEMEEVQPPENPSFSVARISLNGLSAAAILKLNPVVGGRRSSPSQRWPWG